MTLSGHTKVVSNAFRYFREEVVTRTGAAPRDSTEEPGFDLACIATHRGGCLRLGWRDEDKWLELAVSHGPPSGRIAAWLDLYRTTVTADELTPDHDVTFVDAVTHGLELLRPRDTE